MNFIEVPIYINFDHTEYHPIGSVLLLKEYLPDKPNWVLSLGYREGNPYEILEFGLIEDSNYKEFIEKVKG